MADSEPPKEAPVTESDAEAKKVGTNNPPPVQYIRPASIQPPEQQSPQVITRIIREPSFTQNLYVEVRHWFKTRSKASWDNLKGDVAFCRDAFRATFAESRWGKMIAVVTHLHKGLNWLLGLGVPAAIITLYIPFIYPIVGGLGTVIVVLSLLVLCLQVTVRVTRRLYEKALLQQADTKDGRSAKADSPDNYQRIEIAPDVDRLRIKIRGQYVQWETKYFEREQGYSFDETVTGGSPLTVKLRNLALQVDAVVYAGTQAVTIKENKLVDAPERWDSNQSDRLFEIVDEKQRVVFQLIFDAPNHITVQGLLSPRERSDLMITRFKYPSKEYPGEYKFRE